MGSLGDGEDGIPKPVTLMAETGSFDSDPAYYTQPTGEKNGDACNELKWVESIFDVEDTVPVEDGLETQLLNFGGETQLVDDLDCFQDQGRTQLVDWFDDEVPIEGDREVSDGTEVLAGNDCGGDEKSDGESVRGGEVELLGGEKNEHGELNQANDASADGQCGSVHISSESPVVQVCQDLKREIPPRFTSVRSASLRASGLAARSVAFEGTNSESFPLQTNSMPSESHTEESGGSKTKAQDEADLIRARGRYDDEANGLKSGSKCKIVSSTVRKLFTEDLFDETEAITHNSDIAVSIKDVQLPCDDGLAGLSYIDSQDPGEASQANALACVQKLIDESKVLFDDELDLGKGTGGKSSSFSAIKGPQSLAKKANVRGTNGKGGIFDWDDRCEDEGGGDFFSRKKDEFFGSKKSGQKSSRETLKLKGNHPERSRDTERKSNNKSGTVVHADSSIVLSNLEVNCKTAKGTEKNIMRDLVNDFDEEFNLEPAAEEFEAVFGRKDMPEMLNVGVDTQMAAEAMEALFNGEGIGNPEANNNHQCLPDDLDDFQNGSSRRNTERSTHLKCGMDAGVSKSKPRKSERINTESSKQTLLSSKKHAENPEMRHDQDLVMTRRMRVNCTTEEAVMTRRRKHAKNLEVQCDQDLVMTRRKRAKLNGEETVLTSGRKVVDQMPSETIEQRKGAGLTKNILLRELDKSGGAATRGHRSAKKRHLPEELTRFSPISRRTRQSLVQLNDVGSIPRNPGGQKDHEIGDGVFGQGGATLSGSGTSEAVIAKNKFSKSRANQNLTSEVRAIGNGVSYPRGRRSLRKLSGQLNEPDNINAQLKPFVQSGNLVQSNSGNRRSRSTFKVTNAELNMKRKTRSSISACLDTSSVGVNLEEVSPMVHEQVPDKLALFHNSADMSRQQMPENSVGAKSAGIFDSMNNVDASLSSENVVTASPDKLLRQKNKACELACTPLANCMTPAKAVSPVCMGDGYFNQSCKKDLSRSRLLREISGLCTMEHEPMPTPKDSRKRRDLTSIKVLFSQHLDDDTLKQQRKIVDRLKIPAASSILDATHFIADQFVRTRNMLEAIACGKPIVTHLWLEDVGRANYYIDEQKYILRDTKKEREFGFNMSVSLAHARHRPLLQGRRVFITSNAKPAKETIASLVKAVRGQAIERVGRSALKDNTFSDDLLILSCEEDYEVCVPFLEKGAAVYSSELLLNGIVTQKLEYERHRLFADHVKRTRSTVWLKKDGRNFIPVKKHK